MGLRSSVPVLVPDVNFQLIKATELYRDLQHTGSLKSTHDQDSSCKP
jgi:hypothetical protein